MLGVWVAGWLVANMYTHPNENGPVEAGKLLIDLFIADRVAASQAWVLMGDHNEVPSDSSFMGVARAMGGFYHGTGQPTRWEGNREIDWLACNRPQSLEPVVFGEARLSDHKPLVVQVRQPYTPVQVGVLPRTGDLRRPLGISTEDWRQALEDAWQENPQVDAQGAP